jgi:hypothetical protein
MSAEKERGTFSVGASVEQCRFEREPHDFIVTNLLS